LGHSADEREQLMLRIVHFGGVRRNAKLFLEVHNIRLYFFSKACGDLTRSLGGEQLDDGIVDTFVSLYC
jgi:hypothetical protein